jgi:BirA family biotin operon repressor/biotin-[acetyl-CoA-carboxylase] ligase
MDGTDWQAVAQRLSGRRIGGSLHFRPSVDSTNRVAAELARQGAPEGTVVLADGQTAGRGRLQRGWQSPPGCNLYLSILLRPAVALEDLAQITLLAGVAVADAVAAECPAGVSIKWPNDLLIRGRKVCGILTEMRSDGGSPALIVGIGLNVNIRVGAFDPTHRTSATSLREETGRELAREDLFLAVCESFASWYDLFLREGFEPLRLAWLARSDMAGKRVRVRFREEVREGVVAGIDQDGALLLADGQGKVVRIVAGDATLMKE